MYNPNELIINKQNIIYNINIIKQRVGVDVDIMPVIKADAYGIGANNILEILKEINVNTIAVATVNEAIEIRKYFKGMIMVLLQPFVEQILDIIENNLTINVSNINFLMDLNNKLIDRAIDIHLEIDTGMGRTGIGIDEIPKVLNEIGKLKKINLTGISTHFSTTSDVEYTKEQISKFNKALKTIKEDVKNIKYIHACGSGGILNAPQAYYNLVRPGIMIYGYYPGEKNDIELKPALSLSTRISYIHSVNKGDCIGYNKTTIASRKMILGIIPLGFADAFMGLESNVAHVMVHDKKAKIIAICMDTMIIDLTNIKNAKIGDKVVIWDNNEITLEDWGKWTNTSNYEVISILSKRIKRIIK